MERIKALLAVALFVAGLIFATPMNDKNSIEKYSFAKTHNQKKVADTSNAHYKIQPANKTGISENAN